MRNSSRERKEKGSGKKKDQELEQDKDRIATVTEAGRTQACPSPMPEQESRLELAPAPHPCQTPPPPVPLFFLLPGTSGQLPLSPVGASTMAGASKTVVKRTKDMALEHVKWAIREGANPLTKPEVSFVCTSCHILGIDSATTLKAIVRRAQDKGKRQPRKVLEQLQIQLKELAERVDKHKRPEFKRHVFTSSGHPPQ